MKITSPEEAREFFASLPPDERARLFLLMAEMFKEDPEAKVEAVTVGFRNSDTVSARAR